MRNDGKIIIMSCLSVFLSNFTLQASQSATETPVRYEVQFSSVRESRSQVQVWMKARFYNDSQEDIAIPLWGQIKYNDIFRFEITDSNGQKLVGPVPTQLPEVIPAGIILRRSIPTIDNSPFVLIKAKDSIECEFVFQPLEAGNVQVWFFPRAGQYTLTAEFVNTHSSYVDSLTEKVVKMNQAFIGSVKSKPVKFTVSNNFAESGFEIRSNQRPRRGNNMIVFDANPEGLDALTISGTTIDEEGKPISDIIIEITANKDSGLGSPQSGGDIGDGIIRKTIERRKSDSDGKFKFTGLPSGADSYVIRAVKQGNYIESIVELSNKNKTNRTDIKITMKKAISIRGKGGDQNSNSNTNDENRTVLLEKISSDN